MIKLSCMLKIHTNQNAKLIILINKLERTDLKRFNGSEAFIEYSDNMVDIYKNIEDI